MNRKLILTIEPQHVGRNRLRRANGFPLYVGSVLGMVQPIDVGKRVYSVGGIIQVENNEQRDARVQGNRP